MGACMIFRKHSLLFLEHKIAYITMVTLFISTITTTGLWILALFALPFIVLIFVNPSIHNEFITINENGIVCQKAGARVWVYNWEDIAELRKSSHFRMPSIEIIPYNKQGEPEQFSLPGHYFQLGRIAKKAIEQYHKTGQGQGDGSVVP